MRLSHLKANKRTRLRFSSGTRPTGSYQMHNINPWIYMIKYALPTIASKRRESYHRFSMYMIIGYKRKCAHRRWKTIRHCVISKSYGDWIFLSCAHVCFPVKTYLNFVKIEIGRYQSSICFVYYAWTNSRESKGISKILIGRVGVTLAT